MLPRCFKSKYGLLFVVETAEQLTEVDRYAAVLLKRKDDAVDMQLHICTRVKTRFVKPRCAL